MLWRIIHKDVPKGAMIEAETAKEAIKILKTGLHDPTKMKRVKAVPMTLEWIQEYLKAGAVEEKKNRAENPTQYINGDGTPATAPGLTDPDEVSGVVCFGLEF